MSVPPDRKLVIGLVAENENQVLESMSTGIGHLFEQRGYAYRIINLFQQGSSKELLGLLTNREQKVAGAFAYAGVGNQLPLSNGINLWTATRTPFVSLWFDHPAHNYRQHIVDSPYVAHCYHVCDHMEARQRHLPPSSSHSMMLYLKDGIDWNAHAYPFAQRQNKILFVKTALQPESWLQEWAKQPPLVQDILRHLAEQAQKDRNLDLADATALIFKNCGLDVNDLDLFMGVIQEVDGYIRAWRSDRLARALLPHPAHIIGRGWDYLKDQPGAAEFFPPILPADYVERVHDYRIIANSSPLWRDGIHERAYIGMGLGALVMTDRTVKADAVFAGLPNYLGFDWQDDLQDVIATALRLAGEEQADYVPAVERALTERVIAITPDYIGQIEKIFESLRQTGI